MRITAIFILGVSLHVSANSFSQSITISAKKITIEKAFRLIEEQTDLDRKSTRLNSSHQVQSRMPSSA